jgi:hypothetical protein
MVIWGWVGGLNTPVGITCHTRASLCYSLRFWGVKKAAFEPKPPLCNKTKLGLMCLVETSAKEKICCNTWFCGYKAIQVNCLLEKSKGLRFAIS